MPSLRERRDALRQLKRLEGPCFPARRSLQHEILLERAARNGRTCPPPDVSPFMLPEGIYTICQEEFEGNSGLGSWSPRNFTQKFGLCGELASPSGFKLAAHKKPLLSSNSKSADLEMKENMSCNGSISFSPETSKPAQKLKTSSTLSTISSSNRSMPDFSEETLSYKYLDSLTDRPGQLKPIRVPTPESGLVYMFAKPEHCTNFEPFKQDSTSLCNSKDSRLSPEIRSDALHGFSAQQAR